MWEYQIAESNYKWYIVKALTVNWFSGDGAGWGKGVVL